MGVPAVERRRQLVGHECRHGVVDVVAHVIATGKEQLGVVGHTHFTIEDLAIAQVGVDVLPSVGPRLLREVAVGRRRDGGIAVEGGHGIIRSVVELVAAVALDDVATSGGSACPLRLVVVGAEERCAIEVHQHANHIVLHRRIVATVLQLTVGQRRGSIEVGQCTSSQARALRRACHVQRVALPVLNLAGSLLHLVSNVDGAILVGAAWNRDGLVVLCVVDTLVGHDGDRTIAAQQQPVVVGTGEASLAFAVDALLGCHLLVHVDVMNEHRCLIDALVGLFPSPIARLLVVLAELEGVVGVAIFVVVVAVLRVAVTIVHIVGEAVIVAVALRDDVGQLVVHERVGIGEPLFRLCAAGEDGLERFPIVEVLIGVEAVGAAGEGEGCRDIATGGTCQEYFVEIVLIHNISELRDGLEVDLYTCGH